MFFRVDFTSKSVKLVFMKREKWLNELRLRDEFSKIRKEKWEALKACERVPWETWKRLVANMGLEKARLQAEKIIKKKLDKQS